MVKCNITKIKVPYNLPIRIIWRKIFTNYVIGMEKTALIQEFKTRVGEDDAMVISDKTFEGIADEMLPSFADDTKITDETWKLPIAILKKYAGQKRHDDMEFTKKYKTDYEAEHEKDVNARIEAAKLAAVEEYKKAHPEKQEKKDGDNTNDDIDTKVSNAVEEKIKTLLGADSEFGKLSKGMTEFLESQKNREKTETRNRVKAELKKHLIDQKANSEVCVDDALEDIEYGDNPTFDALKETARAAYEKRYKRYFADGGKPFGGDTSGGGGGGEDDPYKKHVERLKDQAKDAQEYEQSVEFAK